MEILALAQVKIADHIDTFYAAHLRKKKTEFLFEANGNEE